MKQEYEIDLTVTINRKKLLAYTTDDKLRYSTFFDSIWVSVETTSTGGNVNESKITNTNDNTYLDFLGFL